MCTCEYYLLMEEIYREVVKSVNCKTKHVSSAVNRAELFGRKVPRF